jgi:hypothetical protein
MTNFETMPIGTKERLRELERKNKELEKSTNLAPEVFDYCHSSEVSGEWIGLTIDVALKRDHQKLKKQIKELEKENQKLKKMIDLGLGWEDMKDE